MAAVWANNRWEDGNGNPLTEQQMQEWQMATDPSKPMLATFDLTPEQQAEAKRIADEQAARAAAVEANRVRESRFQYGGHAGGATEAANRYNQRGEAAQGRAGEVIDTTQSNQTRGSALGMADLMARRARGETPSIAQAMADRDMGRVAAEQTSNAASARGPAALALANQVSAANTASAQSRISEAAQIAAANERLAAEQAAFGAYGTMRGQDAQGAQAQANVSADQRRANDAFQMGMTQAEIDVQKSQLGAQGNKVAIESGATTAANALAQQKSQADRDNTRNWILGGAGVAGGLGAAALSVFGGSSKSGGGTSTPSDAGGTPSSGYTNEYGVPDYNQQSQGDPDDLFDSDARAKRGAQWPQARSTMISDDRTKLRAAFMAGVGHEMNRDNPAGREALPAYVSDRDQGPGMMTGPRGYARPAGGSASSGSYESKRGAPEPPETERAVALYAKRRTGQDAMMAALAHETPMAESNRALASEPYAYKPGFAERAGQAQGEVNVGPMAQRMAESPVAGTAVSQDPQTGTLVLDRDKLAKITAGGVADLQAQVDQMRAALMGGRR